jgi:hypothetical protein
MKFNEVEKTWICQLGKPEIRTKLEGYRDRKDRSSEELIRYYRFIISTLKSTPAWGVSGVNKMVNELTASVIATLTKAKKNKTSAYAHAGKLLAIIDFYSNTEAETRYCGNYKLGHILTDSELDQLLEVAELTAAV